jgi:hypothetical protein
VPPYDVGMAVLSSSTLPAGLLEHLRDRCSGFADLSERHQRHIAQMLWDFANNRYQHTRDFGAAFSSEYMRDLWGNLRTRNLVVKDFFHCIQGDNISHLISSFTPHKFLGEALVEFLEDPKSFDVLKDGKRIHMPPNVILSRAANSDPTVTHAKRSVWVGVKPSHTLPINQEALLEFSCSASNPRQRMSALRLLKLSRNTLCPGSIPLLYEQKSTGRLAEVFFAIQNTQREVLSAALHGHWDYDLNNAHFSILSAWAKRLGKTTPVVDEYMRNRKEIRIQLNVHCNDVGLEKIKECLIALLYGAPLHTNPDLASIPQVLGREAAELFTAHPFVRGLKKEILTVGMHIVNDTHSNRGCYVNAMGIEAKLLGKKNPTFKLLCHALQGVEALTLKTVIEHCGKDILLCMHDGWVSRRRLDCDKLKSLIYSATGFDLEIEEQQLPKYLPEVGLGSAWRFMDSTPVVGGFVISNSPQWNAPKNVYGRVTRPDVAHRAKKPSSKP